MLPRLNLSVRSIMLLLFFQSLRLSLSMNHFEKRSTLLQRNLRISLALGLFPYKRRFLDPRIASYISLFYESEIYSLEEFCADLVDVLHVRQPFAVQSSLNREPVYTQLTLF